MCAELVICLVECRSAEAREDLRASIQSLEGKNKTKANYYLSNLNLSWKKIQHEAKVLIFC